MTRSKFGLKASQFRGRSIREKVSERRKRSAQDNIGFCIAGATPNARRFDLEPAEECVEHPRPIIMYSPDPVAVRADPAGFGNFLDLVVQDRILQLPQDRLRIFEQQPEPLRLRASKRAGQTAETMPLCGSVLKGRLDNNPHFHGSSLLNEPPTYTDTPKFCPLPVRLFEQAHPGAQIRLHEGDIGTLTQWLEGGQIDVALSYDFGLPSTLDVMPLADVRPYGLVPADHGLARRRDVSLAELLEDPLILMNLPHSRDYFLTLAQMQGVTPQIAYETGSVEMLRSMVANGMGVGLMATDIPHGTAYDGRPVTRLPLSGNLASHRVALVRSGRLQPDALTDAFCLYAAEIFA